MASGWPRGQRRTLFRPFHRKTAKCGPQPPKSAIESHLRFAESFRVHGPISTSEFVAVSTPPPRNNSLRYSRGEEPLPSPFSAFLSESLRLCVNSSPPAPPLHLPALCVFASWRLCVNWIEKTCLAAWRVRQSSRMAAIPRLSANTDLGRKLSV